MTPIRTVCLAVAAALLTGTAAAAVPASAAPAARHVSAARHAVTGLDAGIGRPVAAGALTGATPLTLDNGTRIMAAAPWAAMAGGTAMAGRARGFLAARPGGFFCFYGAAQSGFGPLVPATPANVPKYTQTIKGFDLTGAPANLDGWMQVFSATSMRWNENTIGPTPVFRHGLVTMHVPAGKYWLIGQSAPATACGWTSRRR